MRITPVASKDGVPTSAFIQLSDRCNHACTHCYQVHGERGEMSTAEVLSLLDEMAAAGVLFLTLTGGEVTLRHDFLEIVAHARRQQFALKIYSNAYRIDDGMAAELARLGVMEVQVSLYSARPDDHDSVTLVPGSFEKTVAGVTALRRHGVKVVLKSPLMGVNESTYGEIRALARSLGCECTLDPMVDVREDGDMSTTAMRPSAQGLARFMGDTEHGFPEPGDTIMARPLEDLPCGVCGSAYVMPDGTVRPCTSLPFEVGHVLTSGYAGAYRESPTAKFVRSVTWNDLPACRVCEIRSFCARCHASALLEDGDMFGPASTSCRFARATFHQWSKSSPEPGEPAIGPYRVVDGSRLAAAPYERVDKRVPDDVKWVIVQGKTVAEAGAAVPASRPRVRLPVLGS